MALNPQVKNNFDRNIARMREDGFFTPDARKLSGDTRYLIISYGGTGADALFGVKEAFEKLLPAAQLDDRVRFLAIDTDKDTQKRTERVPNGDGTYSTVQVDALTTQQFFQLNGAAARLVYDTDAHVQEWINPKVKDRIRTDNQLLNGDGASGTRQIGRLTLYPGTTVSALHTRVLGLVSELTANHADPLKVFILTGIAGGTGSGTVVDLTYLIRNIIEHADGAYGKVGTAASSLVSYAGFVLLPPTGTSSNPDYVNRGNRNGYAALKEINHFMTLKERGERYEMVYGDGRNVVSDERIFDVCYLMDGTRGGVPMKNPRAEAVRVLAESLLDMVSSSYSASDGTKVQAVDSFMNDFGTTTIGMVAGKSIAHAKRDADYVYCALGHSEFAMPMNQIRAFVAKQMFDRIYGAFRHCENVSDDDADAFLTRVRNRHPSGANAVMNAVYSEAESIFTNITGQKGGPFYVINLMYKMGAAISKARPVLFGGLRQGENELLDQIDFACTKLNNEMFSVYTSAMDAMAGLMAEQFGTVISHNAYGTTYSFMPESMGGANAGYVVNYLQGLINPATLNGMTRELLRDMIDRREEWLKIVQANANEGINAMRSFWNDRLNRMVNSTIEDFLIKYFSGDPAAHFDAANPKASEQYLEAAAKAIYQQMLGSKDGQANAMVSFTEGGLSADNFNGHTYLMVPKNAPHLRDALAAYAKTMATAGNAVQVCDSEGTDRVSCYKQYTSIPAYKLVWAFRAEKVYEEDLNADAGFGMHMSETVGGKLWKNFPNLLPKSTWPVLPDPQYCNVRENKLAVKAEEQFAAAEKLGLTVEKHVAGGSANMEYTVKVLPKQFRPDENLYKEIELYPEGSQMLAMKNQQIEAAALECAKKLYAAVGKWENDKNIGMTLETAGVKLDERKLRFPSSVLSVGPSDALTPDWDKYMAACMLRKLPETMEDLGGTLLVMEQLQKLVTKAVKSKTVIKAFAQFVITDMFTFNPLMQQWEYADRNGVMQPLTFLESEVEKAAEYYFMFDAVRANFDGITEAILPAFAAKVPDMRDPATRIAKQTAFREAARQKAEALRPWLQNPTPYEMYRPYAEMKGYSVERTANFYRALWKDINDMAMVGYMPVLEQLIAPVMTAAPQVKPADEFDF